MEEAKKRLKVYCETSFWSYLNGGRTPFSHIAVKQAFTALPWFIDLNAYDPVLKEIFAIRRKISEQYGHNVYRLAEAVAKRQHMVEAKGRKYVRLPIARVAPAKV